MKFNKQKSYNDPAQMFPGNNRNKRLDLGKTSLKDGLFYQSYRIKMFSLKV